MLVAICQIEMLIIDSHSLKDKRSVVKSLKERIRQKFNVSIAEVAENDHHSLALLGVAIVSNNKRHLEQIFTKILTFIEQDGRVEIVRQLFELG
ncbi:MAG: DUF503 domain-containing protein [Calditrichaeota bacterium]|nr:MAG: DUF503 domain-containing protein [Calditrichota bacterium]